MTATTTTVSSGYTLSGKDVVGSSSIVILSGGSGIDLSAAYRIPGGTISVYGHDTSATIFYDGEEAVLSGGTATATTLSNSGAEQVVGAGGVVSKTDDSGAQFLNSGASSIETEVRAGAGEVVSAGAVARDTEVLSGGFVVVLPGGILDPPAVQAGSVVMSTGIALYDPLSGFTSDTKAEATGLTVGGGAIEYVLKGGDATKTIVSAGGSQRVFSGGTAANTTVKMGGIETINSGAESTKTFVDSGGTETVVAGGSAVSTTIATGGVEFVSGGVTAHTLVSGGTLELAGGAVATSGIDLAKTGSIIDIVDSHSVPTTLISGFVGGDSFDFGFLTSAAGDKYTVAGDIVTVSAGGHTYALDIANAVAGGYKLNAASDGSLVLAVCYFPGTLIRTPSGDVPVEKLAIGNDVVTFAGATMSIRWIGRNTVSTRFADPLRVLPIRIRAGALGDNQPERDLLVSPEHAVLVDDILVQAAALVNGVSIIRERNVPEVFTYYHVELIEHALILAEGLPAESFVDNIHRMAFDNWHEHEALYGESPIREMQFPRAQSYRQVPIEIQKRVVERGEMLFGEASQQVA